MDTLFWVALGAIPGALAGWTMVVYLRNLRRLTTALRVERLRLLKDRAAHYDELSDVSRAHSMFAVANRYAMWAEQDRREAAEMETAP